MPKWYGLQGLIIIIIIIIIKQEFLCAAQLAAAAGVPVLLDAGGVDAPLPSELLQYLTVISPNETELQRLTGLPTGSTQELLTAAHALQQRAAEQNQQQQQQQQQQAAGLQVLLKLGTAGSIMVPAAAAAAADDSAEAQIVQQPAIAAPAVVDTTGRIHAHAGCAVFVVLLPKAAVRLAEKTCLLLGELT
jgi:ribokinase